MLGLKHGQINNRDTKANCRHLKKKFTCKVTLRLVIIGLRQQFKKLGRKYQHD
jgi:hypothetical protein